MSTETNKAAVRRFREALNAGDLDGAIAVFAPLVPSCMFLVLQTR